MKIRLIPNLRQSLAPLFQEIYRRQVKSMRKESFYNGNRMTVTLEMMMDTIDSLEAFEKRFPSEFLANDDHVGEYLQSLLWKYDQKASVVSTNAMLAASYVGNIINGKKRDALISICFAIGTTVEEVQYLLRYAGQAPLYVRRRRDVVIWFGFMKQMRLDEVDEKLRERGLKPLIKDL